jgi:hypothetical protein
LVSDAKSQIGPSPTQLALPVQFSLGQNTTLYL